MSDAAVAFASALVVDDLPGARAWLAAAVEAAFPGIALFHVTPNPLGQFQTMRLEFFPGVDRACKVMINIIDRPQLAHQGRPQGMRYMAMRKQP